jgi:hypothetical protein
VALELALSSRRSALVLAIEVRDSPEFFDLPFIGKVEVVRVQGYERDRHRLH